MQVHSLWNEYIYPSLSLLDLLVVDTFYERNRKKPICTSSPFWNHSIPKPPVVYQAVVADCDEEKVETSNLFPSCSLAQKLLRQMQIDFTGRAYADLFPTVYCGENFEYTQRMQFRGMLSSLFVFRSYSSWFEVTPLVQVHMGIGEPDRVGCVWSGIEIQMKYELKEEYHSLPRLEEIWNACHFHLRLQGKVQSFRIQTRLPLSRKRLRMETEEEDLHSSSSTFQILTLSRFQPKPRWWKE